MRDISLLMASVLTTGQTNVPELPEELPEPPQNTQQQLRQDREIEVSPSTEIAPPEFVDRDMPKASSFANRTLELSKEQCNYSDRNILKHSPKECGSSQTPGNSSQVRESLDVLQSPQSVITPDDKTIKQQNILKGSRNKIQFKDSFFLTQEAEEKEEQEVMTM